MVSRLASSLCMGAAFVVGVAVAAITCSSQNLLPGQLVTGSGACSYPRACYLVKKSGPLSGQCDDCTGGPSRCRLYFVPTPGTPDPLDLGGVFVPAGADLAGSGVPSPTSGAPAITDQPVVCGFYPAGALPADTEATCATPESLCVARGPLCTGGYCVHAGGSCTSSTLLPITPQRRPGMPGPDAYCPYTDNVCCAPASTDAGSGGGPSDLGALDAGAADAGNFDAGTEDAGAPLDAQPG